MTLNLNQLRSLLSRLRALLPDRFLYWPFRTAVQIFFLLLFLGVFVSRIFPWVPFERVSLQLPVVANANAPGVITSVFDGIQLLLGTGSFPWFPLAIILVSGAIVGRLFCGWVCPVGFTQDIVTFLKGRVDHVFPRTHKTWIRLKYALLILTLLVSGTLGLALVNRVGTEYQEALGPFANGPFIVLGPDGTLFGTVPILIAQLNQLLATLEPGSATIENFAGWLRSIPPLEIVRFLILAGFLYGAYRIPRFWCRYFCPVGGIMSVFQKFSFLGVRRDPVKCGDCPHCEKACPMEIPILDLSFSKFNHPECILCGACMDACPHGALSYKFP